MYHRRTSLRPYTVTTPHPLSASSCTYDTTRPCASYQQEPCPDGRVCLFMDQNSTRPQRDPPGCDRSKNGNPGCAFYSASDIGADGGERTLKTPPTLPWSGDGSIFYTGINGTITGSQTLFGTKVGSGRYGVVGRHAAPSMCPALGSVMARVGSDAVPQTVAVAYATAAAVPRGAAQCSRDSTAQQVGAFNWHSNPFDTCPQCVVCQYNVADVATPPSVVPVPGAGANITAALPPDAAAAAITELWDRHNSGNDTVLGSSAGDAPATDGTCVRQGLGRVLKAFYATPISSPDCSQPADMYWRSDAWRQRCLPIGLAPTSADARGALARRIRRALPQLADNVVTAHCAANPTDARCVAALHNDPMGVYDVVKQSGVFSVKPKDSCWYAPSTDPDRFYTLNSEPPCDQDVCANIVMAFGGGSIDASVVSQAVTCCKGGKCEAPSPPTPPSPTPPPPTPPPPPTLGRWLTVLAAGIAATSLFRLAV